MFLECTVKIGWGRDSVVGIMTKLRARWSWVRILAEAREFFSILQIVMTGPWGPHGGLPRFFPTGNVEEA